MAGIQVETELAAPIFICLALCLEYICITFLVTQRARFKHFPQHWLKANFGEEHRQAFGKEIPTQGYPDMGDGKYSSALSYKDWVQFNIAMRVQKNFLQQLGPILFCTMVAAFAWWIPATVLGGIYLIGRLIYSIGMMSNKGVRGRIVGVILTIPILGLQMGLAFIACFKISGLISD